MVLSVFCCFGMPEPAPRLEHGLEHPVLQELQELIHSSPRLYLLFQSMVNQAPGGYFHDYHQLLSALDGILKEAPSPNSALAGVPMMEALRPAMGTVSGYAVFIDPRINAIIKNLLNAWGVFLSSPESTAVLNTSADGWFGPDALRQLTATANVNGTKYTFEEIFVCDATAPAYGFKSWDAFFTRPFRQGIRPVASPDDDDVIANACESRPFAVAQHIKARDIFWLKGKIYSLYDMLGGQVGDRFLGGTVYQAYLDSYSYHRWHAPVSGRILQTFHIDGTYFSTPSAIDPIPLEQVQIDYQHYLAAMAARAVVVIEADNPDIGEVAFLAIGMEEVSTCEILVNEGDYVRKGDQIGMFHYGGSSYCLVFQEEVNLTGFPDEKRKENVPVCGQLAIVSGEKT